MHSKGIQLYSKINNFGLGDQRPEFIGLMMRSCGRVFSFQAGMSTIMEVITNLMVQDVECHQSSVGSPVVKASEVP